MAMGGVVQSAPEACKLLKYICKKPRPLHGPLVGCKALFLLTKTPAAESCMTCVEILRLVGPIF